MGGKGSVDVIVSVVGIRPGFSSLETRGVWERGSIKSNDGMFGRGESGQHLHLCCSKRQCEQRNSPLRA